jgi:hypothetical protein
MPSRRNRTVPNDTVSARAYRGAGEARPDVMPTTLGEHRPAVVEEL